MIFEAIRAILRTFFWAGVTVAAIVAVIVILVLILLLV